MTPRCDCSLPFPKLVILSKKKTKQPPLLVHIPFYRLALIWCRILSLRPLSFFHFPAFSANPSDNRIHSANHDLFFLWKESGHIIFMDSKRMHYISFFLFSILPGLCLSKCTHFSFWECCWLLSCYASWHLLGYQLRPTPVQQHGLLVLTETLASTVMPAPILHRPEQDSKLRIAWAVPLELILPLQEPIVRINVSTVLLEPTLPP